MRCVQTIEDILNNICVLDNYLNQDYSDEYTFGVNLIKRGTCFIALSGNSGYRFYPSRFIGYANNTMYKHLNNDYKDGKETNPAISSILKHKAVPNSVLEEAYKDYCEQLGFTPNQKGSFGVERKYWELVK